MIRWLLVLTLLTVGVTAFAGDAEQKAQFEKYKKLVGQDPSLIRFYTFEEGEGIEVRNHVLLDPSQAATTGGTLGSLTLQRYVQESHSGRYRDPGVTPPGWTRGRWPWKSAVVSGIDTSPNRGEVTKLFRSGITGKEFAAGGTLSGWIRIHENAAPEESCNILTLGDGARSGFLLNCLKGKEAPDGALRLMLGVANAKTPRADLWAAPFSAGVWHHFAMTLDGTAARLFIDGELKAEKPFAEKVIPTTFRDYPLVGPFYENNAGSQWGEFLMIAHNVAREGKVNSRFDIGELAIYNRALTAEEIGKLELAGAPAMTPAEQLEDYRALSAEQKVLDQIRMDLPGDSGGYFRIAKPIVATVEIPAATGLQGDFTAAFKLESLFGKPVREWKKSVQAGKVLREEFLPPECGVYYLDITLRAADGHIVKRLPEKLCFAVVPPAPASLTEHNPVGFWADYNDAFSYDAPIRRMVYLSKEKFTTQYEAYAKRIPDLRTFVWFYCPITATPEAMARNKELFTEAAEVLKTRNVFAMELTNEPHATDIKGYVDMLRLGSETFRAAMPGVKIIPPGAAPPSVPMISKILEQGGINYVDGVSYHPYTWNPINSFLWKNLTDGLKQVVAQYPDKKLTIWNTEGGINSLPRLKGRPMTGIDAHAARFPSSMVGGHEAFSYFIGLHPEMEAAALQCHAILLDLLAGYQLYVICQTPNVDGQPSLRGVAVTALAGQVLNTQSGVTRLPLSAVENMCLLIKQADETTTAAIFSMEPATVNFKVPANAEFRTMDMLGNYGTIRANADGLLTVVSDKAPLYLFDVPPSLAEVVPLKLAAPKDLPENGILKGELTVSNPFAKPLEGELSASEIQGATITLGKRKIHLAPGESERVEVELKAELLKRRTYLLGLEWKDPAGGLISAAQAIFNSPGVLQMVPQMKTPVVLDGDAGEWKNIPAVVCDDSDSVVRATF